MGQGRAQHRDRMHLLDQGVRTLRAYLCLGPCLDCLLSNAPEWVTLSRVCVCVCVGGWVGGLLDAASARRGNHFDLTVSQILGSLLVSLDLGRG